MFRSVILIALTILYTGPALAGTSNSIKIEDLPKDGTQAISPGVPYEFTMSTTAREMAFGSPVLPLAHEVETRACMEALSMKNHFFPTTYNIENYLRFNQEATRKLEMIITEPNKFLIWFKKYFVQAMVGEARQRGHYKLPFLDDYNRPHFVVFTVGVALGRENYANRRVVNILSIEEPNSVKAYQEFGAIITNKSILK